MTGGFCPDWYAWVLAAKWLNTDPLTLEAHPDGEYWANRAFVGIDAENRAERQRNKPKPGQRGA